jgi:hypothetical protein
MQSVQELIVLADRVAKLDALASAAVTAEAVTLQRPATDPNGITRRREVTLSFVTESLADAFIAAMKAITSQPTAAPLAMTTSFPAGAGPRM